MQKHKNGPFLIAMLVVLVLLISGLAGIGYWVSRKLGRFEPQRILLQLAGNESGSILADEELDSEAGLTEQAQVLLVQLTPTVQIEEVATESSGVTATAINQNTPVILTETPMPIGDDQVEETSQTQATTEDAAQTATIETASTEIATNDTPSTETAASDSASGEAGVTELPDTRLMDDLGVPLVIGLSAIVIIAIAFFRRLKSSI